MGWFEFLSGSGGSVPIARCVSEATTSCDCVTGTINCRGHLVCSCGIDHGEYAGPNERRKFLH